MFETARAIHIAMVLLTVSFFVLRSAWAFVDSPRLKLRTVRVLPHFIDTALLASALTAAALLGQYPFVNGWLTAKFFGLLGYIVLGHITLWRVKNNRQRAAAFAAALLTITYIVLTALCHDPMPFSTQCWN
jgi:uncharacterized membrane protein SirB2